MPILILLCMTHATGGSNGCEYGGDDADNHLENGFPS